MKTAFSIIILAFAIATTLAADGVDPQPTPTTSPALPNTTSVTSTTSTTTAPTTSHSTTTTSPTTTTNATTTTTTTTTTAKTTVTTAKTTTVAPKPSTTPAPPKEEVLHFKVVDSATNVTCIIMNMTLKFKVPYEQKNKTHVAEIIIPKTATATGHCGKDQQSITIIWNPTAKDVDNITMEFRKNDTKKDFMISSITGTLSKDNYDFPDADSNETINFSYVKSAFPTSLNMSYKCDKEEFLNLTVPANVNKTIATFVISKLRMEAFRVKHDDLFSEAEDCVPFETSGIVPIAVGCSLAALIIIVLIAYLIGRRRTQARGYLSM